MKEGRGRKGEEVMGMVVMVVLEHQPTTITSTISTTIAAAPVTNNNRWRL